MLCYAMNGWTVVYYYSLAGEWHCQELLQRDQVALLDGDRLFTRRARDPRNRVRQSIRGRRGGGGPRTQTAGWLKRDAARSDPRREL